MTTFFCLIFGHSRYLDDMGGVIFEVCRRCPWVGRSHTYQLECRLIETNEPDRCLTRRSHEQEA
jgi:hypothetical protein